MVLNEYFVFQDKEGWVYHTIPNHKEYMSIQLINVNDLSINEIEHKVKQILLKCSIELGLNFKVVRLEKQLREIGTDKIYKLQIHENEYEAEPLMYFNNGISTGDIRMKYLSYYQVIEYFFNRAQNYKLLDEIRKGNYISGSINHTKLTGMIKKYVSALKEREALKLVLLRALDITIIKDWISSNPKRVKQYCNSSEARININLSNSDEKIIGKLAERIYYYRCSIAHAKGNTEEYLAVPEQSDDIIKKEIPLLKLISEKVLKECSEF